MYTKFVIPFGLVALATLTNQPWIITWGFGLYLHAAFASMILVLVCAYYDFSRMHVALDYNFSSTKYVFGIVCMTAMSVWLNYLTHDYLASIQGLIVILVVVGNPYLKAKYASN